MHLIVEATTALIFIVLAKGFTRKIAKTGENGDLKLWWFNIPISALSNDIQLNLGIAGPSKIAFWPDLWSKIKTLSWFPSYVSDFKGQYVPKSDHLVPLDEIYTQTKWKSTMQYLD